MRHGETTLGNCYCGTSDVLLNDTGWQQMQSTVLDYSDWDIIITSPLKRCAIFSEEISKKNNIVLEKCNDLKEISFGNWEGRSAKDIMQHEAETLSKFWSDPLNNSAPNGEPLREFQKRIIAAWQKITSKQKNKHVLIVTHAGVIRIILTHILELPIKNLFRIKINHGGISRIEINGEAEDAIPQLLFLNGNLT